MSDSLEPDAFVPKMRKAAAAIRVAAGVPTMGDGSFQRWAEPTIAATLQGRLHELTRNRCVRMTIGIPESIERADELEQSVWPSELII